MIYFNDEVKAPKAPPTRLRLWLGRLFWGLLILGALVWISLRALMSLGGNDPQLHTTIENYLGQTTGLTVRVGDLHWARFYPISGMDIADVGFLPAGGRDPEVLATLGAMKAETDFWDHVTGRAALQAFELDNLNVPPRWIAQALHINRLAVEKTGPDGAAALRFKGHYGATPLFGTLAMRWARRSDGRIYFQRPAVSPFSLHAGSLDIAGTLHDAKEGGVEIDLDHVTDGDLKLAGNFVLVRELSGAHLSGTLQTAGASIDIALAWTAQPGSLTATISAPAFDMAQTGRVAAWVDAVVALIAPDHRQAALRLADLKIALAVKALKDGSISLGALNGQGVLRDGVLTIGPATFDGVGGATPVAVKSGACGDMALPPDVRTAALAEALRREGAAQLQGMGTVNFVAETASLAFTGGGRKMVLNGPLSALHLKSCAP